MIKRDSCLFSILFHQASYPPGPYMFLQMANFHSFLCLAHFFKKKKKVPREWRESWRILEERVTSVLLLEALGGVWKKGMSLLETGYRLLDAMVTRCLSGVLLLEGLQPSPERSCLSPPSVPWAAVEFLFLNVWCWLALELLLKFWGMEGMGKIKLSRWFSLNVWHKYMG